VWAALVALLAFAGRFTIIDSTSLSMVWPAAGAAVLWFGTSRPGWWLVDGIALAVTTGLVNHLTGASWKLVPVFALANLEQVLVAALILRRTAPRLWAGGGRGSLRSTTELWSLTVAAVAGSLAGAGLGSLGMIAMTGTWTVDDFLAWWGRNAAGIVAVAALALLVARSIDDVPATVPLRARFRMIVRGVLADTRALVAARAPEACALLVFTGVLYWSAFVHYGNLPVAFPLMIATVWAGLRFPALFVHLHSIAVSSLVVALTLGGIGPFAHSGTVHAEAMIAELFIAMTITFGLSLAIGRDEREALLGELAVANRAASDQALRLTALVDQMRDGVTLVGADGDVLLRNPAGGRILGKLGGEGFGDHVENTGVHELLTLELQPVALADRPLRRALDTGEAVTQDLVLRRTDEETADRVLQVVVTPFDDPDGARQALVVYRDVTDEHAHLRSVESFAAVVAHDLNTPLTVVDGWTEMLLTEFGAADQVPSADVIPMLDRVHRAAGTMRLLIRDLLSFSRARDAELAPERVELTSLAHAAAQMSREAAADVVPQITVAELPAVTAEPALVRQVLDNLIGNAVKYTPAGATPRVSVSGRTIGQWVEVTVADHGIGIPLEKQGHVFEAFFRAHAGAYAGHGLGLAICKRIIDRYGGNIRVQDNPGGGTQFVFTVPAAVSRTTEVAPAGARV